MPWDFCAFGNPCNAYLPWASYISNLNKSSQCIALSLICWVEVVQVTISQMHFAKEVDHFQHPALQISESDENVNVGILDFTIPMQMSKYGSKLFKVNSLLVLLTEMRLKRNSWQAESRYRIFHSMVGAYTGMDNLFQNQIVQFKSLWDPSRPNSDITTQYN